MEGQAPQNNVDDRTTPPPLRPPLGRPHNDNMYIVQFPKDQVYRVPPRENALLVERYRNPQNVNKTRGGCSCPRFLLPIILILVAIIAIVGITFATLLLIFNPMGPTFTVTSFVVNKNPKNNPQYEVSMRVKNPNERLAIFYENSDVSLLFEENNVVATGKFSKMEQKRDASSSVKVELMGTALPKKMAKSMDDVKSKTPVALGLNMRLRVRINVAELNTWVMKARVVCKYQVNSLGNDTRILSQQCDTNFKQY